MQPDASTTGFLSTQESRMAKRSQFVAMSGATGVIALARKNNPPANGYPYILQHKNLLI